MQLLQLIKYTEVVTNGGPKQIGSLGFSARSKTPNQLVLHALSSTSWWALILLCTLSAQACMQLAAVIHSTLLALSACATACDPSHGGCHPLQYQYTTNHGYCCSCKPTVTGEEKAVYMRIVQGQGLAESCCCWRVIHEHVMARCVGVSVQ
jgi:hypothetical protein